MNLEFKLLKLIEKEEDLSKIDLFLLENKINLNFNYQDQLPDSETYITGSITGQLYYQFMFKPEIFNSKKVGTYFKPLIILLIKYGWNINFVHRFKKNSGLDDEEKYQQFNLLHKACTVYPEYLPFLLSLKEVNLNQVDGEGFSPIYLYFTYISDLKYLDMFLDRKVDLTINNQYGQSLLKEPSFLPFYQSYKRRKVILTNL